MTSRNVAGGRRNRRNKSKAFQKVNKNLFDFLQHKDAERQQPMDNQSINTEEEIQNLTKKKQIPYIQNKKPLSQMEANDQNQINKLKNHIVVCGIHSSIYHLILPLRAKYLKSYMQDIVIINPTETVPKHIWATISKFQRIFVVFGSPLDRSVLRQAQIEKADKAVILSKDSSLGLTVNQEITHEMLDARNIFIFKAIKRCNPTLQILTELSYSSNIEFLQAKQHSNLNYTFQSMYAAGEVYISSIIDTLTAQACYNPHIVTILQQILVGKNMSGSNKFEEALEAAYGDKFSEGNIW